MSSPKTVFNPRKLLEDITSGTTFEKFNQFRNVVGRFESHKNMNVVNISLNSINLNALLVSDLKANLFDSISNFGKQNASPIFHAPNKVIVQKMFTVCRAICFHFSSFFPKSATPNQAFLDSEFPLFRFPIWKLCFALFRVFRLGLFGSNLAFCDVLKVLYFSYLEESQNAVCKSIQFTFQVFSGVGLLDKFFKILIFLRHSCRTSSAVSKLVSISPYKLLSFSSPFTDKYISPILALQYVACVVTFFIAWKNSNNSSRVQFHSSLKCRVFSLGFVILFSLTRFSSMFNSNTPRSNTSSSKIKIMKLFLEAFQLARKLNNYNGFDNRLKARLLMCSIHLRVKTSETSFTVG